METQSCWSLQVTHVAWGQGTPGVIGCLIIESRCPHICWHVGLSVCSLGDTLTPFPPPSLLLPPSLWRGGKILGFGAQSTGWTELDKTLTLSTLGFLSVVRALGLFGGLNETREVNGVARCQALTKCSARISSFH